METDGWVMELAKSRPLPGGSAQCHVQSTSGALCLGCPWVAGLGRGRGAQSEVPASGCGGGSLAATGRRSVSEGHLCLPEVWKGSSELQSSPGSEAAKERGCVRVRQRAGEEEEGGGGRRSR